MTPRVTRKTAGIFGAVLGLTAAGVAAGVAAERYIVRRSRKGEDPYADEPFGDLPATEVATVRTENGLDLRVEIIEAPNAVDDLTIVFVHGFCLDMGTFHFQRVGFTDEYRMVFYDQPGHGRSGRLKRGDYTFVDLATALAAVIDRAAPTGRIVLVGHSMGGMAIMAFAERYEQTFADRVVGVALISTSSGQLRQVTFGLPQVFAPFRGPILPVVRTAGPVAAAVVDRARHASTDLAWLLTRKYGFGERRPSSALVSYVERMNASTSLDVIARYLHALNGHDGAVALERLRSVPVLVLCGDRDMVTPISHSETIAAALPDARFEVISGAGHVALLENAEEVNEIFGQFLRKVDDVAGGDEAGGGDL